MLSKYFLQSQEEAEGVPVALANCPLLPPPLTTSDTCTQTNHLYTSSLQFYCHSHHFLFKSKLNYSAGLAALHHGAF